MSDSSTPPPTPLEKHSGPPEFHENGPSSDEKNMAMLAHLLVFTGYVVPLGNIIGPLIIYLIKKDESSYIRQHAAEALNFQISVLIYFILSLLLCFVLIGVPMLIALFIVDIVCTIIAAIKASEGTLYRYPLTIRFVS